jgi:hypothetical protein
MPEALLSKKMFPRALILTSGAAFLSAEAVPTYGA